MLRLLGQVLLVACIGSSVVADGQSDPCANRPCRDPATIEIPYTADSSLSLDVRRSPYLTDEHHIVIEPGEKLVFRFDPKDGRPGDPHFVRAEASPPESAPDMPEPVADPRSGLVDVGAWSMAVQKAYDTRYGTPDQRLQREEPNTLIITYRPIPGTIGMMLTVEHNLPHRLKYSAFVSRRTDEGRWVLEYTNTCAVKPFGSIVEGWPNGFGAMVLRDFTFLSDKEPESCE